YALLEFGLGLARMGQDGAGTNGVDADGGGQRLGKGLRCRPKHRLGQGVAEIGRAEMKHPLVDHVDDISLGALRQLVGEVTCQEYGGFGVDRKMLVPHIFVDVAGAVRVKDRGIVDEGGERAEETGGPGDDASTVGAIAKVGLEDFGSSAGCADLVPEASGAIGARAIMNDDRMSG